MHYLCSLNEVVSCEKDETVVDDLMQEEVVNNQDDENFNGEGTMILLNRIWMTARITEAKAMTALV
ncbi:MAG: hypothetical protein AAF554_08885 [Bacteroidota bacterium]